MATESIDVNPSVLAWARTEAGLTREDAAALAEVDLEALSSWETGQTAPTISHIRKLAIAYKRPFTVLLLPEAPAGIPLPTDFRTAGGAAPALSPATHLVIRRARRLQSLLAEVADEIPSAWPAPRLVRGDLGARADLATDAQRTLLGVTATIQASWSDVPEAIRGWRRALQESAGVLTLLESIPPSECRGMALWDGRVPAIIISTAADEPRTSRVFTIAHELAHLTLNQDGVCLEREDDTSRGRTERWCNRFAGALLVPGDVLTDLFSDGSLQGDPVAAVTRAANRLKVSRDVLAIRLEDTGRVDKGFYQRIKPAFLVSETKTPGRSEVKIPATTRVLSRVGAAPVRALSMALNDGLLDMRDVADVLNVGADRFSDLNERAEQSLGRAR